MTTSGLPTRSAATAAEERDRGTALSPLEWPALGLCALSIVLLYSSEANGLRLDASRLAAKDVWLFAPHLLLTGVIVAGLRRVAVAVTSLLLLAAAFAGFLTCVASIASSDRTMTGVGVAAALQLLLFWVCRVSARDASVAGDQGFVPPRLALGALVVAAGWFATGAMLARLDAPRHAAEAAVKRSAERHVAEISVRDQFFAIAVCLQRSPAGPDSQPRFPASLAELAKDGCAAASTTPPTGFAIDYSPGAADSGGARHTFKLAAHEEPMTDSSRSFTMDETLRAVEWYGNGARRSFSSATEPVRILATAGLCIENARDTVTGRYPASISEMQRTRPCELRLSADSSSLRGSLGTAAYVVRYSPPTGAPSRDSAGGYTLAMEPERDSFGRTTPGALVSFLADSAGLIHVTRRPRPATVADPVIPDCPTSGSGSRAGFEYCREYRPRQRWGLTSQLPTIGWSISGSGTVASGDTLHLIPHYMGVTPGDSIVEARIRWNAAERDSVIRRGETGIGEPFAQSVIFRLKHVYRDTGYKEIRFRVRTRKNEEYEMRDSIRVLMGWRKPVY